MRQFGLVVGHLADVVQQTGAAGRLGVQPQLGGHDAGQVGRLAGVLQQVLAVGGAVLHLTDQTYQFGMQAVDAQVDGRALADLDDLLLDLLLDLGDHLLDTGGVDAAVGHQLVERQTGDLAAHGVEAAQDDRFGGVVDDDFDARRSLQGANVATLAADDAALHLVAVDVEHRDGILDGGLGGDALNRGDDDALGLFRGGQLGLLDRLVDVGCGVGLGLGLHVLDQDVLGILRAHAGDLLQPRILLAAQLLDLLFLVLQQLQLVLHLLADAVVLLELVLQIALLILQVVLDLLGALLALGDPLIPFVDLTVVFTFELYELLLRLKDLLLLDHLAFGFGLLDGGLAALPDAVLQHQIGDQNVHSDSRNGGDAGC